MRTIKTKPIHACTVRVPGSKSISHRMLILASLANGRSVVNNLLDSQDIRLTRETLAAMGADILETGENDYTIQGFNGQPGPCEEELYLGNSGTSMRLLAGIASLGVSDYILTGDARMQERPMGDLLKALDMAGIHATSQNLTGAPPVLINGKNKQGGKMTLDCSQSSQYLSSVLMMGALLPDGLEISLPGRPVSMPYIILTMDMMKKFGVTTQMISDTFYKVPGSQHYQPGNFAVEPDLSNAGYFWAAGAVTGEEIIVQNSTKNSLQGDLRLLKVLEKMGCTVTHHDSGIGVSGRNLKGIDVDMGDIPDVVPTLAVVAAFATGKTVVRNIAHLREKECDRIDAVVTQLKKMGIKAAQGHDWLSVTGGAPKGAFIETYNDHRIAMAFSIAGLNIRGMEIENQGCVAKSFPTYFEVFDTLYS